MNKTTLIKKVLAKIKKSVRHELEDISITVDDYDKTYSHSGQPRTMEYPGDPSVFVFKINSLVLEDLPKDFNVNKGDELVINRELKISNIKVEVDDVIKVLGVEKGKDWFLVKTNFDVEYYGDIPSSGIKIPVE